MPSPSGSGRQDITVDSCRAATLSERLQAVLQPLALCGYYTTDRKKIHTFFANIFSALASTTAISKKHQR